MSFTTLLLAVGATFCWGATWVLMKAGVDKIGRTALGFTRPWFGLLFIVPFAWATHGFQFGSMQLVWIGLGTGVLNAVLGVAFFYYALERGSMHETNILAGTNPFWGALSAILILQEPAHWTSFVAAILIVAGTYFLVRRDKEDARSHGLAPFLAALAAGVLWGITVAVPGKYCLENGMSPIAFQLLFTASGALGWTVIAAPKLIRRKLRITRQGMGIALASAFTGFFLGWVLWLAAVRNTDAGVMAPLNGLTMFFSVVLGAIVFRERLSARVVLGGTLMLAGVTLISVFVR